MSSEETAKTNNSNLFLKLWRGEIPLWQSYWIYGALVGVALRLLSPWLTYILVSNANSMSKFDTSVIWYAWSAIIITYGVVVLVGIWRSANKYAVLNPKNSYATSAKVGVVLGALSIIAAFGRIAANEADTVASLSEATSADERMQYQALISGINADLPKMVDSITRLNKIDVKRTGYIYYETLIKEFDDKQKGQLLNNLKPILASGLCKNTDTLSSLNGGLSYTYIYSDSKEQPFGQLTITKSACAPL